jgi:hypothetical protein
VLHQLERFELCPIEYNRVAGKQTVWRLKALSDRFERAVDLERVLAVKEVDHRLSVSVVSK